MAILWDTRGSNSGNFSSTDLKFGSFIAKYLKSKTVSVLFLKCQKLFRLSR